MASAPTMSLKPICVSCTSVCAASAWRIRSCSHVSAVMPRAVTATRRPARSASSRTWPVSISSERATTAAIGTPGRNPPSVATIWISTPRATALNRPALTAPAPASSCPVGQRRDHVHRGVEPLQIDGESLVGKVALLERDVQARLGDDAKVPHPHRTQIARRARGRRSRRGSGGGASRRRRGYRGGLDSRRHRVPGCSAAGQRRECDENA